jgi:hypothetical protein
VGKEEEMNEDNQPRYSIKRMQQEIREAKRRGIIEALNRVQEELRAPLRSDRDGLATAVDLIKRLL